MHTFHILRQNVRLMRDSGPHLDSETEYGAHTVSQRVAEWFVGMSQEGPYVDAGSRLQ